MLTRQTKQQLRPIIAQLFALRQQETGANLALFAVALLVLLGFAGVAVDGSNIYFQNQRMQIAADAAALAGARQLALGKEHGVVNSEIEQLAFANDADGVTWNYINSNRGVHVVAERTFVAYFARLYGYDTFTVNADAEAQYEPVTGVDDLFPLTIDCDCVDGEEITPGGGGGGGGGGATPTPAPLVIEDGNTPTSGTVSLPGSENSAYGIAYLGRTGNTWTYEVNEISGKDLSHWLLNINTCLDDIVTSQPSDAEIGIDGSTGMQGIKWNVNDGFSSGTFSFTLNDDYPAGLVNALAKAGNTYGTVRIRGPVCDGTNVGSGDSTGGTGVANVCLPALDFETDAAGAALVTGQIIDTEWAAWGVRVASSNVTKNPPMIFNSASPTGGDTDLGTPNEAFGGPGKGTGGGAVAPGRNGAALGKLLIVAERNNSSDPDDNSNGGSLIFTFDYPVRIDEVQIVDIDDVEASGTVKAYSDAAGATLIATGKMLGLGDNSLQTVAVNARGVRRLEVKFAKSGGLAAVTSCRNQSLSTYQLSNLIWSDTNGNGLQDPGEPGIPGVELELYISGLSQIVARTTTNAGGEYFFPGLPAGSYTIKIASSNFTAGKPLAGASYSPANVGGAGAATATPTATFTPAPTATFTPTPVPPTATPASSNYCQVTYTVTNDWGNGFGTNVRLTNLTGSRWNDWTVTWSFDGNQQITNLWNGTLTQSGQAVQVRALSWNKKVNAGASVEFGFNGAYSGANPLPNNFRVNGNLCNGSGGGSSPTATPAPPTATPTATAGQGGGGSGPTPTPILLCTGNNPDVASAVTAMNQYNLITLDDLQNFGEVDARAFVGGNYSVSNWAQFGTHLGSTACSDRVLTVVGNIATNGINIQKGTIAVRTQPSSLNVNWNSGCGPNLTVDAALSDAQITAYMQNTAAALAGMTANNPAPTVSAGGDLVFNVTTKTPAGLAVFNVSGATVFSNNSVNGNIEFNNGAGATTILVNVSGASINWSRANMGNFLGSYNGNITKVIWNLHQATSFSTNSRRFAGALLAPYASVNAGSGNLEGSTVVKTLVSAGEIHDPVFSLANSTPLSAACQVVTPTPAPPTPTATPVPSVNDDTRDSDFIASTGKAPGIIVNIDNPTVDGGFILPPVGNPGPMSGVVNLNDNKGSQYEISLVGVSGTTWTYRVREVAGRDLSHWDLGIVNCLDKITSYSPTSGFASGTDGSTGFVGIKWDVAESFTDSTFSFTLNGDYQMSTVRALAKAGTGNAQIDIAGPDCSLPGTNPPSPTPMPTPGGTIGGGEGDTCAFGWLDWNGSVTSYLELQSNMNDTGRSGVWRMAEMIPPGPDVVANALVNSALDARKGSEIKIPLTHYNGSGYAICGFANVKLIDYRMEEGNVWLNLQFLQTLVNGVETNPAATDFGARDVRFKR